MGALKNIFSPPKAPEPQEPVALADENDTLARRARRQGSRRRTGGRSSNRATQEQQLGQEYSRGTLG